MAQITNKLVHFNNKTDFDSRIGDIRDDSIVFVKDATIIQTHQQPYYCGSGPVALKSDLANYATTSALTSGLASKANTSHTHSISQITNLQSELNSKIESLSDLGVTATATELNYVDGVTSNIQTQLNGKAASLHVHSAANITSGTLNIARLPSITDAKITSISATKITGTIPQENLPSYVDDVLEYSAKSSFPQTGESGKIYVDTTTNLTYRWSGSTYVEISPSLALGETSSTAYRGDKGKTAYDHSQATGNPHNLTLSDLGINATATELNYMDGVTSNVQDQLDSKVSQDWVEEQGYLTSVSWAEVSGKPSTFTPAAHTHSASDITSGTLSIARIPTGTSSSTVAIGNHTHGTDDIITLTGYTEGTSTTTLASYMALNEALASLQNQIQARALVGTLDDYALKAELAGYLPLTGGALSGGLDVQTINAIENLYGTSNFTIYGGTTGSDSITLMGGQQSVVLSQSGFTYNGNEILTEANWNDYITVTDTKNTAGTANSMTKLYLIGGRTQSSTGVVTYSNDTVYTQSGQLYATRMNATNGFYETSDGTLKNIKSELNIADNIDKIPTVLFSWKKDESEDINQDIPVHIGTIAQDIQKIYPDLVSEDAEGHLTVDYARLSVVAIAAIKELKKEIEVLKSKIN